MRAGTCAAVLALLLAALVPAGPATAAPSARVTIVPRGAGLVRPGDDLNLDVTVANPGTAELPSGSVGIGLDPAPPAGPAELADRLAHPAVTGYLVATAKTPSVAAGRAEHVRVTVPAATLHDTIGPRSGARLVNASLSAGSSTAIGAAALTYLGAAPLPSVGVTTVLPLTAPAGATGLVTDPAALSALVAPDGAWGRALEAAQAAPGIVLALDPAVIASVRLLGSAAPDEVRGFLSDLRALPNEQLELAYADGDLALQRAAGASRALGPTSFRNALATPKPDTTSSPSPSPTATPAPATAPAVATLLDWPWSAPKVAWPVAGTVRAQDLAFARASGYRATLLAGSNVRDTAARAKAGPHARVGGSDVLVADPAASALLTAARSGQAGALANLVAMLATDATSGTASDVLLAVDRSGAGAGLAQALRVLSGQPWLHPDRLRDLVASPSPATVALARPGGVLPADRVSRARRLLAAEAGVRQLGTALQDPAAVTGPERLALLGLLSAAWRRTDADWLAAAETGIRRFADVVGKVRIDQGSAVNYIGGSGALPITIINNLDQPVTVVLHGAPDNSRLTVEGTRKATVPAESSLPASLPVRSISNGQVQLRVSITTTGGWEISHRTVEINVAAGWETVGALVFGLGLAALLATGLYRNLIVRRRKDRRS